MVINVYLIGLNVLYAINYLDTGHGGYNTHRYNIPSIKGIIGIKVLDTVPNTGIIGIIGIIVLGTNTGIKV